MNMVCVSIPFRSSSIFFQQMFYFSACTFYTSFAYLFFAVQSLSHVRLFVTRGVQHVRVPCPSPSFPSLAQTHWVGDAIQPFCLLLSPSPPIFYLSQHQGLFQWVRSLHEMARVLELQHQSFQWVFRVDFL